MNLMHKIIAKNVRGSNVLDIGFAQAPNLCISKDKHKVYGIDIQKSGGLPANYIEIKGEVNLNSGDIPYADGYFDTVIMADVIEHVENPSRVLRECNRVLKDAGRLIVSTPQANYPYDLFKNSLYSFFGINLDRDPGSHLSNWTILDFKRLLNKNSFVIKKLQGGFVHLPFGINIPVTWFPILGWQAVYVAEKTGSPKTWVYTKDDKGKHFLIAGK